MVTPPIAWPWSNTTAGLGEAAGAAPPIPGPAAPGSASAAPNAVPARLGAALELISMLSPLALRPTDDTRSAVAKESKTACIY